MNMSRPCFLPHLFFFCIFFVSFIFPFSSSQSADSPQNIETFFPLPIVFPSPPPSPTNPNTPPNSSFLSPPPLQLPERSSSSSRTIAKAVAATAASTFVVATLLFFLIQRYVHIRRSKKAGTDNSAGGGRPRPSVVLDNQFARVDGNLKGVIVDEDGLDVLYWRKLEDENKKNVIASFNKVVIHGALEQEDDGYEETDEARNGQRWKSEPIQEIPLLRGNSSTSHNKVAPEISSSPEKPNLISQTLNPPPPPPPPPPPSIVIPAKQGPAPPPIPAKKNDSTPPPPLPPPVPAKKSNSIPTPIPEKKSANTPPPPPPPKAAGLSTSSRLPPVGKRMPPGEESSNGEDRAGNGNGNGQVKLKPLHWDKLNRNTDHSMVWDKIGGGSFR